MAWCLKEYEGTRSEVVVLRGGTQLPASPASCGPQCHGMKPCSVFGSEELVHQTFRFHSVVQAGSELGLSSEQLGLHTNYPAVLFYFVMGSFLD